MRAPFASRYNQEMMMIDDDCSVSSTVDISDSKVVPPIHTTDKTENDEARTRTRCVQFEVTRNVEYVNHQVYWEDCKTTWYARSDYRAFKEYHKSKARSILQVEKNQCDNYNSFQHVMERVFEACCFAVHDQESSLVEADEQLFTQWIAMSHNDDENDRLGMERVSSRAINTDKFNRRRAMWETVLEIQENDYCYSQDKQTQMMAAACQDVTRASRMFATYLGSAQALAV